MFPLLPRVTSSARRGPRSPKRRLHTILDNLTCSGAVDAQGLVDRLQRGEIEGVIAELPNCTWSTGSDW